MQAIAGVENTRANMAILVANKLTKSFGQRQLFENVSFQVDVKDRIGLVGVNGSGKTTLFQILCGIQAADGGTVYTAKTAKLAYLEQMPHVDPTLSVYEAALDVFSDYIQWERELDEITEQLLKQPQQAGQLIRRQHQLREALEKDDGLTYRSRTRSMLRNLGFSQEELEQPFCSLSGGQASKVMLARLLLVKADLLLLDEPTNHLDITAVEWLEGFLKEYRGAFIVISHDRYFLDNITARTLELRGGAMLQTAGNYTTHLEQQSTAQEVALRHYRNTQREIKRLYGIVEQQRRWNRERNIRTAESKLKQIARLEKTLVAPEKDPLSIRFLFSAPEPGGNDVLIAKGIEKSFGSKNLFRNLNLHIRKGERVFLLGPNGCGKTTLLKILIGQETADQGSCILGTNVERGYYEQNMSGLSGGHTILDEVCNAYPRMSQNQVRNALAAFLFRGDDVQKTLDKLSGGERARIQLLKLMLAPVNLLLLDEPTNHLDIASREALENALEEYTGTMLIVTHDRYLVNRLADRVLYMTEDGLEEFIGGYDAYLEARTQSEMRQEREKPVKVNDYKLQKERNGKINRAKGILARAEQQVADQEAYIRQIEEQLATPEIATDYKKAAELAEKLEKEKAILDVRYNAWEEAERELQALLEQVPETDGSAE